MDLVIGVDAGGTASRAVAATLAGQIVGRGTAGPGNPISCGPAAATAVGAAIGAALSTHDPSRVAGGVLGLAGTSAVSSPEIADAFARMWAGLGLRCPRRFAGDVVTAFAAGTPSPSGRVLIAGTGAIAARITDHEMTDTADGLGWLLGDEGSGRWIGLQALRHAVRHWTTPLAGTVAAHAGVPTADALIRWAQSLPLADIDALAPLVCAAARAGDPAATAILAAAAAKLLATLDQVGGSGPVVLAGGLLTGATPLRDRVLAALHARDIPTGAGHDPAAAAAWLAARPLSRFTPVALHAALLPPPADSAGSGSPPSSCTPPHPAAVRPRGGR